ncbi:glycosyltransferase [Dactylosporangium sp. CA-052675]|uniref:glycosyltransferase n=1 Tax=Dactylosporangium sp. CA-052675 TaxID=3239927 RepID=UPI003D924988
MSLTVVSTYFPLPPDRGDPVRVLMMLRALARRGPYRLLVVRRPATTPAEVAELRALLPGVRVEDFPATPYRLGRLGPLGRFSEAALAGLPPWVRTRYSHELHERLRGSTGAAIGIGEAAGAYFRGTTLRWHWDKANVLAASTLQDIAEAPGPAQRLRARHLARVSRRFEAGALALAARVSVTSEAEAERLARHHGRRADIILPSCVPLPDAYAPRPEPGRLIWLGSFAFRPNLLGLRRFLGEGWAVARRAGYTLSLIGSGLTDAVRVELARHDGVEVLGYVQDLRPVLATARAAVVPVWSGAGVKLKTLTLLAHAVPVFSTAAGAEGVPATAAVRLAETPAGLAEALVASTEADLDRMAPAAVRLVRERFSEESFAERLLAGLHSVGGTG